MRRPFRKRRGPGSVAAALVALVLLAPPAGAAVPAHGRAWELVTTGPTNGVNFLAERAWRADGDGVVYTTLGPMPGSPSGDLIASGLATRTASGWTQRPIGEPFTLALPDLQTGAPLAISADMSEWLWSSSQPLLPGAPPAPQVGMYHRAADGSLTLLGPVGGVGDSAFVAASDDVGHAVFQSAAHLLPADAGRMFGGDAYEFAGSELRLVGVDAAGAPISPCGSEVGNGDAGLSALTHVVSRDGARIFFSAPATGDCGTPRRVYLRENGSQTTEISASDCSRPDCDGPQDATFAGASPDGSSAFVVTTQQLTNDDTDASADLYRYDVGDHSLTRISAGPPGVDADVSATSVRASDDGTRVYFIASGALVPGQGAPGGLSLYLSDRGTLRFVAPADGVDLRNAAVAADGRTLAFATPISLLPSDGDTSIDAYRYDAVTGTLEQASRGVGERGNGEFGVTFGEGNPNGPLQPDGMRYMSADGSRIAFVTSEPLVPADVNTTADVYEWADGAVGLVSSGAGDATVAYGGLSADGRSAFFTTDETLVSADRNGGDQDLYDARLGGVVPDAPPPPPGCQGDACQGAPGSRIVRPTPGSLDHVEPSSRRFRIRPLDRRARGQLALTGRATIVVDAPAAGRVSLLGHAAIHGRSTVVARGAAMADGASGVRLHVRLTATARRALRQRGRLHVTLVVRLPRLGAAPALGVTLGSTA